MKEDPFVGVYRALSPEELAQMFMNPNAPKTEAEHWAVREIEKLRAEVERLTRERDEARAWAAKLLATLEMVRDADNDCRVEGWATIADAVRRSIDEALEAKP